MTPPRPLLTVMFAPVLIILLSLIYKTSYLLLHGQRAGLYLFPYSIALWLVGRRARRAWRGELERPWLDFALLLIVGALWMFVVQSQFQ